MLPFFLFAKVHYAKVEPYESVVLKSAVSGLVIGANYDLEGKSVISERIIHIDDNLDILNLNNSKQNIVLLKDMLKLNRDIASSLRNTMQRKEAYYKRISKLSTASKTQKDNAYSAYSAAKTQYLSTKEKIISLQKQIFDMQFKVAQLKDTVEKKSITLKDKYLNKLLVRVGDFVAPGTPLARVEDIKRAKLILFLEANELNGLASKSIYFDGNKTKYKIDKVWRVADEKFISSYRAEIVISAPKDIFSKLIKVEIK
jgi:multidrug resistance efflux pump